MENQTPPIATRLPIDELLAVRCREFADSLTAEIPEIDAIGFIFSSRQLNPDDLAGVIAGKRAHENLSPHTWFQLARSLANMSEQTWATITDMVESLEAVGDDIARRINAQARSQPPAGGSGLPPDPPPRAGTQDGQDSQGA